MIRNGWAVAVLFALTGDVQTGKTRWLERFAAELAAEGVPVAGVIAPGVWRPRGADGASAIPSRFERSLGARADSAFEKLGIDNLLLPQGERIVFARRVDLAQAEGTFDEGSQAARAGLGWAISDEALARVNRHFLQIAQEADEEERTMRGIGERSSSGAGDAVGFPEHACGGCADAPSARGAGASPAFRHGLLVVDELGRLELLRGGGLVQAMALLDRGPTRAFPHALVVVRAALLPLAHERLEPAWGPLAVISPEHAAETAIRAAFERPGICC